uniref:Uncharacterized protein n=1 Tax=Glossina palpalis gambiensis TaxID=67801 RepID=A0A1B0BPW9_9MUSC
MVRTVCTTLNNLRDSAITPTLTAPNILCDFFELKLAPPLRLTSFPELSALLALEHEERLPLQEMERLSHPRKNLEILCSSPIWRLIGEYPVSCEMAVLAKPLYSHLRSMFIHYCQPKAKQNKSKMLIGKERLLLPEDNNGYIYGLSLQTMVSLLAEYKRLQFFVPMSKFILCECPYTNGSKAVFGQCRPCSTSCRITSTFPSIDRSTIRTWSASGIFLLVLFSSVLSSFCQHIFLVLVLMLFQSNRDCSRLASASASTSPSASASASASTLVSTLALAPTSTAT